MGTLYNVRFYDIRDLTLTQKDADGNLVGTGWPTDKDQANSPAITGTLQVPVNARIDQITLENLGSQELLETTSPSGSGGNNWVSSGTQTLFDGPGQYVLAANQKLIAMYAVRITTSPTQQYDLYVFGTEVGGVLTPVGALPITVDPDSWQAGPSAPIPPGTYPLDYDVAVAPNLDQPAIFEGYLENPGLATEWCFAAGTMIETDRGPVAIETLREGDLVVTRDNGLQPLRWIGTSRVALTPGSKLRPIRIAAGALGEGVPSADLLVSPQHRVLVRSRIAQRLFGTNEILAAAKHLVTVDGIAPADDLAHVTYHHLLFDRHEVILSNGAETESLYTGPEVLKSVGSSALDEILEIFPELRDADDLPPPARELVSGRMARKLAQRHSSNAQPLVM